MDLAESLIDGMTATWKPEDYEDEYKDAVMKRIEAKSKKKGKIEATEEVEEKETGSGKVVDIMDLLKKSVEAKKSAGSQKTKKKEDESDSEKKKASK